jgi:hypothetical protein
MTWRKDKILKIRSKEVLENGNDLTFFDISIIKNLVDFENKKKMLMQTKNKNDRVCYKSKPLKTKNVITMKRHPKFQFSYIQVSFVKRLLLHFI